MGSRTSMMKYREEFLISFIATFHSYTFVKWKRVELLDRETIRIVTGKAKMDVNVPEEYRYITDYIILTMELGRELNEDEFERFIQNIHSRSSVLPLYQQLVEYREKIFSFYEKEKLMLKILNEEGF